jgi:hypothetical protein
VVLQSVKTKKGSSETPSIYDKGSIFWIQASNYWVYSEFSLMCFLSAYKHQTSEYIGVPINGVWAHTYTVGVWVYTCLRVYMNHIHVY